MTKEAHRGPGVSLSHQVSSAAVLGHLKIAECRGKDTRWLEQGHCHKGWEDRFGWGMGMGQGRGEGPSGGGWPLSPPGQWGQKQQAPGNSGADTEDHVPVCRAA